MGAAVARRLAAEGRHVTVVGRRRDPLAATAPSPAGDLVVADLATAAGPVLVANHLAETKRRCVGVVAAAGGLTPGGEGPELRAVRDGWQAAFESNVLTAVLLVEALRDHLVEAGGRVVLLSSVAALRGSGGGPYGAMKAALHAGRSTWRASWAAAAVPPTSWRRVCPGHRVLGRPATDEMRADRVGQTLVGRVGAPTRSPR